MGIIFIIIGLILVLGSLASMVFLVFKKAIDKSTLIVLGIVLVVGVLIVGIGVETNSKHEFLEVDRDEPMEREFAKDKENKKNEEDKGKILMDESSYLTEMTGYGTKVSQGLSEMGILLSEPVMNDKWVEDMAIEMVDIQSNATKLIEMDNVPEKYEEVHKLISKAMEYYYDSVDTVANAVDNNDAELMLRASEQIEMGTEYTNRATEKLSEISR